MKAGYLLSKLSLSLLLTALPACGRSAAAEGQTAIDTAVAGTSILLPLPEVPDSIFDPVERADYVLLHYWEGLDFRDPKAADETFMDANFGQFAEHYQYASTEGMTHATLTLLQHAEGYPDVYRLLAKMARKHLYSKDSPYYSEKAMLPWLKELARSPIMSVTERERYAYLLEAAEKNSPGKIAADFRFIDVNGREYSLHSIGRRPYTLLVFYDPDCSTCHEILERVRNDKRLMGPVNSGHVRVLLVDVADDRDAFIRDATTFPTNWVVGMDVSEINDKEIYVFDTTPSIYLLDADRRVLLKDASIDELVEYAQMKTGE